MAIFSRDSHKGEFTAFCKSHGWTVKQGVRHVLAHPDRFDSHVVHMAEAAKGYETVAKNRKSGKREESGESHDSASEEKGEGVGAAVAASRS